MSGVAAVDPGVNGGIVAYVDNSLVATPMPETVHDLKALFADLWYHQVKTIVLEQVTGFVSVPGRPQPASNAFKFGKNVGQLEGIIAALGFRLETVRPQVWQAGLGLFKKPGEDNGSWKNRLKDMAQRLHPNQKVTKATADAFLILEYFLKTTKPQIASVELQS